MKIGVPKEIMDGETRVGIVPTSAALLVRKGHEVTIERGAGLHALFADEQYEKAGARIESDGRAVYGESDVVMKVLAPGPNKTLVTHEAELLPEGGVLISYVSPHKNPELFAMLAARKTTVFGMEFIPRITRAQSMDSLSSMATLAGYRAVLIAAAGLRKMFPLMMTAAGSIQPATVLVLGAGVAGLQAIATAKRLGARVEAFDPRPVVREQVESLGAKFIEIPVDENVETAGGYAREQSDDFLRQEQAVIGERLPKVDVVISTAQIFGKRAPILITAEMVRMLRPGSIIVDLAAEQGGNCELTAPGEDLVREGVRILGPSNLPATLPGDASQMYSKNISNLYSHLYGAKDQKLNFEDEITCDACVMRDGKIVNDVVRKIVENGGKTG